MLELTSRGAGPRPPGIFGRRAVCKAAVAATAACAVMLSGCDADGSRSSLAARGAETAVDAELARGELLSFACRPCHGLSPTDESPVGPPLHGLFGRPAASIEGFEYSAALRESGIVWTPETLDAWLAQPETFLPGNDMDFAGFRSAEDRRALIAYLQKHTSTSGGAPIPDQGRASARE